MLSLACIKQQIGEQKVLVLLLLLGSIEQLLQHPSHLSLSVKNATLQPTLQGSERQHGFSGIAFLLQRL